MQNIVKTDSEIATELHQEAMDLGMCEKFQKLWGDNPSIEKLCDMYIRGLDFCVQHDFPSVRYMNTYFRGKSERYGIYTNCQTISNDQLNIIVNGHSNMIVKPQDGAHITIRHHSHVHLSVPDNSFVYVSMRDNCKLTIDYKGKNSRLAISHFGGDIETPELVDKVYEKD